MVNGSLLKCLPVPTLPVMSEDLTHFGFKRVPVAEKAGKVAEVFHSVADKYDLMNDIMSLGTHRLLKRFAVELTAVRPGHTVMDLAGGTGDLTALLAPLVGPAGEVVLCDINLSMLDRGRVRLTDRGIVTNVRYVAADAERLPFADGTFDAITMAFGLRNVTDKAAALVAIRRTLKPAGRVVILEFSKPRNPLFRHAYESFQGLWPAMGRLMTGDRDSYQYLVESIRMHPDQDTLKTMMTEAGFTDCAYYDLQNGVAAIHTAIRPR
jgi:demethylmenaquinone methyltransferase / 2-methoxy-6-polyprenyl-1,4-benzoquinol methylase